MYKQGTRVRIVGIQGLGDETARIMGSYPIFPQCISCTSSSVPV